MAVGRVDAWHQAGGRGCKVPAGRLAITSMGVGRKMSARRRPAASKDKVCVQTGAHQGMCAAPCSCTGSRNRRATSAEERVAIRRRQRARTLRDHQAHVGLRGSRGSHANERPQELEHAPQCPSAAQASTQKRHAKCLLQPGARPHHKAGAKPALGSPPPTVLPQRRHLDMWQMGVGMLSTAETVVHAVRQWCHRRSTLLAASCPGSADELFLVVGWGWAFVLLLLGPGVDRDLQRLQAARAGSLAWPSSTVMMRRAGLPLSCGGVRAHWNVSKSDVVLTTPRPDHRAPLPTFQWRKDGACKLSRS